jgi:hypothetical protein
MNVKYNAFTGREEVVSIFFSRCKKMSWLIKIPFLRNGKNPGPEGPALVHPRGGKCTERRRKEVMPVFERPYLKKNSIPHSIRYELSAGQSH